jgi:hypothetical protein
MALPGPRICHEVFQNEDGKQMAKAVERSGTDGGSGRDSYGLAAIAGLGA